MAISEKSSFASRDLILTWNETDQTPTGKQISQISAYCLDDQGMVLIVKNKHGWGLPGGHPEENENIEQTLKREIQEEANAVIKNNFNLIGYIEVDDPLNKDIEGKDYFQLRFLCHLKRLGEFKKEFETSERQLVSPQELPKYITWMETSVTGQAQYQSFIRALKNS